MRSVFILIMIVGITACVPSNELYIPSEYRIKDYYKPTPEEIEKADCGEYPANYQQILESHYNLILKDPESAKFMYKDLPVKGYNREPSGDSKFCYQVDFFVNARNSFGGYTGFKWQRAFIRDGVVIHSFP